MAFIAAMSFMCCVFLWMSVKIVPEYRRLIVFTLGRYSTRPMGPGVVLLIPFVQKSFYVDLPEVSFDKDEELEIMGVTQTKGQMMAKVKNVPSGSVMNLELKK